jgi:uncharacterized protein
VRLVLDTNVLIAAVIARGHCHELLEHVAFAHDLFTSEFILDEFQTKLAGKFRMPQSLVVAAVDLQRSRMRIVEPAALPEPASRDSDDDQVLATALGAKADLLITGDSDLLELNAYAGIPIVAPAGFWAFEASFPTRA